MKKIFCSIGISFYKEEKPVIAMGQVGHKVDRIVNENLTAFQYSSDNEYQLKEILHKFVEDKIKAYLEVIQVKEAGNLEPLPETEFSNNINANKDGVYNTLEIIRTEDIHE